MLCPQTGRVYPNESSEAESENASESINNNPHLSFLPSSPPPFHPPTSSSHELLYRRSRFIFLCQPCISGGYGYRHSSGMPPSLPLSLLVFMKTFPQSQLAKVIYYPSHQNQSGTHCVTRRNSYAQPCNPPTPTSATATFHWEWDDATRYRGQNITPYVPPAPLYNCDIDDEMQDEQAVEELLNAHTPNQTHSVTPPHRQQLSLFRPTTTQHQQHQSSFSSAFSPPPPPPLGSPTMYDAAAPAPSASSHFVNTDPFYLAAVQSSSSPSIAPPSFFAQAARPAPNSPFNLNLTAQQGHHAQLEPRTVLVGAGQSR